MRHVALAFVFILSAAGCVSDRCRCEGRELNALVIMTDFGTGDGAVSAMKGVANQVEGKLRVYDLTHEIPPFDIWAGAYRLSQTYQFWPKGTVFVSVVDPGVGSDRRSIVARSKSGHIFVNPDNGLLTLIEDDNGLESVRVMDESKQRRKGSEESYTFHGRDLYVYAAARLAAGQLNFAEAGAEASAPIVKLKYQKPALADGKIKGMIPVLDVNYGNVWSNIPKALIARVFGTRKDLQVAILKNGKKVFSARAPLVETFASVPKGKPLLYFNSLLNLSLALNMGDFAKQHGIASGPEWTMEISE